MNRMRLTKDVTPPPASGKQDPALTEPYYNGYYTSQKGKDLIPVLLEKSQIGPEREQ